MSMIEMSGLKNRLLNMTPFYYIKVHIYLGTHVCVWGLQRINSETELEKYKFPSFKAPFSVCMHVCKHTQIYTYPFI